MHKVKCPSCQKAFSVKDAHLGKKVGCKCGSVLRLPAAPGDDSHLSQQFIQFSCSGCNKKLRVKSSSAGRKAKCSCGQKVVVPIPVRLEDEAVMALVDDPLDPFEEFSAGDNPVHGERPLDPFDDFSSATNSIDDPFALPASASSVPVQPQRVLRAPRPKSNPYASPKKYKTSSKHNRLLAPAILLLVFSGLQLLFAFIALPGQIFELASADFNSPRGVGEFIGQIVGMIIVMGGSTTIIWGSINMIQLKNYPAAFAASILAIVPCFSPCVILGIPFGIWALIFLCRPDVKRSFSG